MAELLVVIGLVSTLISLLLPAVQRARERARQTTCQNNLRQVGAGAHSHESLHHSFPYTSNFFVTTIGGASVPHPSVSPHCYLLIAVDSPAYKLRDFADFTAPLSNTVPFSISPRNVSLLRLKISAFQCPSDKLPSGGNSYRANLGISPNVYGGGILNDEEAMRGAFVHDRAVKPSEFTDGLSTTAFFSERVVGDGDPTTYDPFTDRFAEPVGGSYSADFVSYCASYGTSTPTTHDSFLGYTWLYGCWLHTWYNHILTPNSRVPDCSNGPGGFPTVGGGRGAYSARSYHSGGVNVLFADGAVRLRSERIARSIWRAIGTRNGRETNDAL